eukprot:209936-Rhodomonas_salina.1
MAACLPAQRKAAHPQELLACALHERIQLVRPTELQLQVRVVQLGLCRVLFAYLLSLCVAARRVGREQPPVLLSRTPHRHAERPRSHALAARIRGLGNRAQMHLFQLHVAPQMLVHLHRQSQA